MASYPTGHGRSEHGQQGRNPRFVVTNLEGEGKNLGYIVIPVIVEPGEDVAQALQNSGEGYQTVGRVLRAL